MNKKINYLMFAIVVVAGMIPELGFAQTMDAKSQISSLFKNETFSAAINFGLIVYAGYQWFVYFNGFDPGKAFKEAIVPAGITWFAFNWQTALSWVGIMTV